MVEFMKDYVGVVEEVVVSDVDGFVFGNVAGLVFCVAFWHADFKFHCGNMVVLTQQF